MAKPSKEVIFNDLLSLLNQLSGDWEYSGEISGETLLIEDLGFESIDIVVLCTNVEQHYQQQMPFAQFLAEVGQREVRDIQVNELVDFFHQHLT